MNKLDDQKLTDAGLARTGSSGKVLIIACGALAREILDLISANKWQHMDLTCLPAILHIHPEKICDAVELAVAKHRGQYDQIFLAYADCGTGGKLLDMCKKLGVEMVKGPHCYSFFEGVDVFAERTEDQIDAFYLTDFLVRQFDSFVWKPLGLNRHPDLLDMYFGNYKTLVYQAQVDDPKLIEKARECAARLGLEFEYRFTGYGDLESAMQSWASPTSERR